MLKSAMLCAARAGGAFLSCVALASSVWAQPPGPLPSLRVIVTDAQQLAIPGATCTLIPAGSPNGATLVADEHGACVFPKIPSGTYVLRVELDGFDPFRREHVTLTGEGPTDLAAVLSVAKLSQNVTVKAAQPEDTTVAAGSTPPAGHIEHHVLPKLS